MENINDIDVIVIGAGPSGLACAITCKKENKNVLVIERASKFGVKNMYGGAVYLESLKELLGNDYKNLSVDRIVKNHNWVILNNDNSLKVSYKNKDAKSSGIITRYSFDNFLAEYAKNLGVYFANETLVVDLIKKGNKIVGVKTDKGEEIYSKVTVISEGFNSVLAKKAGLKTKMKPNDAILGIKEVIRLDYETINQRFNLKENEGAIYEFFGGIKGDNTEPPLGMGFLYTYKNFVTVGVGISMKSLTDSKTKPYEYLERLKSNEFVSSLIKDGEVIEYSAHSIPETGYKMLPKLYCDGALLVGDAAGLVDSIHFEGTNLAIKSGMLAGQTAVIAIQKNDYSKNTLKIYKEMLFNSFVMDDLKTYKNVISVLYERKNSIFSYYLNKADEFFKLFTTADNKGKKQGYRKFIKAFFKDRPIKDLIVDVISFVKCVINAII